MFKHYKYGDFELDVAMSPFEETVWLTLDQMKKEYRKSQELFWIYCKSNVVR